MSEILKKAKVPIFLIIILIVGFFVYNFFFKTSEEDGGLSKPALTFNEGGVRTPAEDFLPLLNLIKNVSFDESFFGDNVFRSLVDFSEPVKEEQKGRVNPFDASISASASLSNLNVSFSDSEVTTVTASLASSTPKTNQATTTDKAKAK